MGGRLNNTQAPLATALGDPNQTDHCSFKKKKVNRVENVEVWQTTGLQSDTAEDNKQKQKRTVSDVSGREISCITCTSRSIQCWEFLILKQTVNCLCWSSGYQLWSSISFAGRQYFWTGFHLRVLQKPMWVTYADPFWMCLWKHSDTHATQTSQTFQTQVDVVGIQCVPCLHFKHRPCVSCPLLQRMQPTGKQNIDRAVFLQHSMLALGLVGASLPLTLNRVLSLSVDCLEFKWGEKKAWYGISHVQRMCEKEKRGNFYCI